jgi:hypothetical protein
MSATLAADRGLRSQRRHDMVASLIALRCAHRGPAAVDARSGATVAEDPLEDVAEPAALRRNPARLEPATPRLVALATQAQNN